MNKQRIVLLVDNCGCNVTEDDMRAAMDDIGVDLLEMESEEVNDPPVL